MPTQPYRPLDIYDYYQRRSHRWHVATFTDYFGTELIVDDQLQPGVDFAISDDRSAVYLPSRLSPLAFHHRLIEAGVALGCGPDAVPELIRTTRPFLAAAYGRLVPPQQYAR